MYYVLMIKNERATLHGGYSSDFQAYAKAARVRKNWPYAVVTVEERK